MALGPVALSFVGASGKEDLKRIRALHFEHGAAWPLHWLQQRGIAHAHTLFPTE
jgi:type IV secretion system protein VirB4